MNIPPDAPHPDAPAGFRIVEITREPVELYKILKFEGMTESGGHARAAVAAGSVSVNGAIETQKRKKIRSGDTIEFDEHKIFIHYCAPAGIVADPGPAAAEARTKVKAKAKAKAKAKRTAKPKKSPANTGAALVPRTRKP